MDRTKCAGGLKPSRTKIALPRCAVAPRRRVGEDDPEHGAVGDELRAERDAERRRGERGGLALAEELPEQPRVCDEDDRRRRAARTARSSAPRRRDGARALAHGPPPVAVDQADVDREGRAAAAAATSAAASAPAPGAEAASASAPGVAAETGFAAIRAALA